MRPSLPTARQTLALVSLALVAGAAACNDINGGRGSSFSVQLAGDVEGSYGGDAIFTTNSEIGGILLLESGATTGARQFQIVLARSSTSVPTTGDHQIVDPDGAQSPTSNQFVATMQMAYGETNERNCVAERGTLSITSSSGGRLTGSLEFDAICTAASAPDVEESVTVSGTFDAIR